MACARGRVQVTRKMTREQFLSNNRGIGVGGSDLPRAMLEGFYEAISTNEIRMEQREYIRSAAREGWLTKQGGRIKVAPLPRMRCMVP